MQIARLYPVAALLVAGCVLSGCEALGSAAVTPFIANALPTLQSARVSVYVTQANGAGDGVAYGYAANDKANKSPVCTITGQKFDHSQIAVDASGDSYLPNLETGAINVYGPNCGALVASVQDPFGPDVDVALGSNGTFFGVARSSVSICTLSACASELTDPSILQLETAAVDAAGDVWATFYNQKGAPSLIVWPKGSMPGKVVSGYVNTSTPGDLSFDRHGNMISLQTLFPHVFVYRCNLIKATCTNTKTIALRAGALFGGLNASNSDFQVSDYPNNQVDVYSYPAFTFKYSYSRGFKQDYSTQGIAQTP